jgi:heme-degrading monooxygenase HmoA
LRHFELNYGPDGLWSKLFRHRSAYQGAELLRDASRAGRYLTIDRWTSREALRQFKQQNAAEYASLDETFEELTESESFIGDFESVAS